MMMALDLMSFTRKHPSSRDTVEKSFKSGGILGIVKIIVIVIICTYTIVFGFIAISSYMSNKTDTTVNIEESSTSSNADKEVESK